MSYLLRLEHILINIQTMLLCTVILVVDLFPLGTFGKVKNATVKYCHGHDFIKIWKIDQVVNIGIRERIGRTIEIILKLFRNVIS